MSSGGRSEFLGCFAREIEAARAYDAAARRLHGAFACLNFPEEGTVVARPWSLVPGRSSLGAPSLVDRDS